MHFLLDEVICAEPGVNRAHEVLMNCWIQFIHHHLAWRLRVLLLILSGRNANRVKAILWHFSKTEPRATSTGCSLFCQFDFQQIVSFCASVNDSDCAYEANEASPYKSGVRLWNLRTLSHTYHWAIMSITQETSDTIKKTFISTSFWLLIITS